MLETDQDRLFRVLKNDIRLIYDLSPSAITKHLKILEQAQFISRYREGRKVMCRLNKRRVAAMKVDWLVKLLV